MASAILCIMLVTPYLQTYDLVLGIIAIALIISESRKITSSIEKSYVLVSFVPVGFALWMQTIGRNWPVMPVVLLGCYAFCIYRARVTHDRDSDVFDRSSSPSAVGTAG
jgi:membrane-bound metal-dependent hydrolase YbcI (DUF457 family)